jgi:hypothetical protein
MNVVPILGLLITNRRIAEMIVLDRGESDRRVGGLEMLDASSQGNQERFLLVEKRETLNVKKQA